VVEDIDIPSLLKTLDPKARDKLRRVLIGDLIDFLMLHKEERRKALQLLGEIEAAEQRWEGGPGGRTFSPVVRVPP
jgi:hypothetical protein